MIDDPVNEIIKFRNTVRNLALNCKSDLAERLLLLCNSPQVYEGNFCLEYIEDKIYMYSCYPDGQQIELAGIIDAKGLTLLKTTVAPALENGYLKVNYA